MHFQKCWPKQHLWVYCIKAKAEKTNFKKKISWPPKKARLWVLKQKPLTKFFYIFFSALALKAVDAQTLFWSIFLKMHKKKLINLNRFWRLIAFLCLLKNTDQKDICASIAFKAESKPKHKENIFWVFFFHKKTRFFGDPKV